MLAVIRSFELFRSATLPLYVVDQSNSCTKKCIFSLDRRKQANKMPYHQSNLLERG